MRITSSRDEIAMSCPSRIWLRRFASRKQILGAPADDLHAVAQEFLQHLLDRQRARPAVHQGQQDDADGLLQRRELVELVEHEFGVGVAFDVDDQANRFAGAFARFVADGGDALDAFILDEVADAELRGVARLLVGDFVDDDLRLRAFFVDGGAGPQTMTLPRPVR